METLIKPSNYSKQDIFDLGCAAAQILDYPKNKIENIIKDIGGKIEITSQFNDGNNYCIIVNARNDFDIFLSQEIYNRDTIVFVLAHELGHYILHSFVGKRPISIKRNNIGRAEWEANWFAAGFLIPEIALKQYCTNSSIAISLGVPEALVEIRRQ